MDDRTAQVDGVALLLWACDPDMPGRLATPFFLAAAAAAMDVPVEIYFTAGSVRLLAPGVAQTLYPAAHAGAAAHADPQAATRTGAPSAKPDPRKSVLDSIREAVGHGAVLFACSDALQAHGLSQAALIPECTRRGGAVQFMARACDPRWRTLVF
ncbi:MAG TPA: DsrE family protein [Burkholderiaceae bacterium]|nr:DsrE family protein [Burkholderiaceae bacterium]